MEKGRILATRSSAECSFGKPVLRIHSEPYRDSARSGGIPWSQCAINMSAKNRGRTLKGQWRGKQVHPHLHTMHARTHTCTPQEVSNNHSQPLIPGACKCHLVWKKGLCKHECKKHGDDPGFSRGRLNTITRVLIRDREGGRAF